MGILQSVAATVKIQSVNLIQYYYTTITTGGVTSHQVVPVLNGTIYLGKYSGVTEANAFINAQDAIKGCLTKCGCRDYYSSLQRIPTYFYNWPNPSGITLNFLTVGETDTINGNYGTFLTPLLTTNCGTF